jgi:hypothetical protein
MNSISLSHTLLLGLIRHGFLRSNDVSQKRGRGSLFLMGCCCLCLSTIANLWCLSQTDEDGDEGPQEKKKSSRDVQAEGKQYLIHLGSKSGGELFCRGTEIDPELHC